MLGLMYVGAAMLYLLLMWKAVRWAWVRGRDGGGSILKGVSFAALGFLVVYLPVFWNWIPTLAAHHSLCAKDSGFTEFVAPRQWAERRVSLIKQLHGKNLSESISAGVVGDGFRRSVDFAGQRGWDRRIATESLWGMEITRRETRLIAVDTGEVLAREVDYQRTSNFFWLNLTSCFSKNESQPDRLIDYSREMKEEIK